MTDNIFDGANTNRPTKLQIKVLVGIFNALDWNPGLRRPTKSLDPGAWWNNTDDPAPNGPELVHQLNRLCQTDEEFKVLFNTAKRQGQPIPCKKEPDLATYRYHGHQSSPCILRCCFPRCNAKLQRSALIQWVVKLVEDGVLDGEVLVEDVEEALDGSRDEVGSDREVCDGISPVNLLPGQGVSPCKSAIFLYLFPHPSCTDSKHRS